MSAETLERPKQVPWYQHKIAELEARIAELESSPRDASIPLKWLYDKEDQELVAAHGDPVLVTKREKDVEYPNDAHRYQTPLFPSAEGPRPEWKRGVILTPERFAFAEQMRFCSRQSYDPSNLIGIVRSSIDRAMIAAGVERSDSDVPRFPKPFSHERTVTISVVVE